MRRKSGYTLIEILVVIGILGIIVVVGANMFFSILRGSARTQILNQIKQNGDYALEVIERSIRGAAEVEEGPDGESITVTDLEGEDIIYSCEEIESDFKIASDGASLIGEEVKVKGSCNNTFSVTESVPGVKPAVVNIRFDLHQARSGTRPEEEATIRFQTRVTLRNY